MTLTQRKSGKFRFSSILSEGRARISAHAENLREISLVVWKCDLNWHNILMILDPIFSLNTNFFAEAKSCLIFVFDLISKHLEDG